MKQTASAPNVLVARGELNRLVVVGAPPFAIIGSGSVAEHGMGPRRLQVVVGQQFDRLLGRRAGPVAVATGKAFELRDHQVGIAELGIPLHDLVEVAHGEGPQPRPLRIGGIGLVDRVDDPASPIHERVGVEILGKLLLLVGEPPLDGPLAEIEHVGEIIEIVRGQLGIDRRVEVGLAGRDDLGSWLRGGRSGLLSACGNQGGDQQQKAGEKHPHDDCFLVAGLDGASGLGASAGNSMREEAARPPSGVFRVAGGRGRLPSTTAPAGRAWKRARHR